MAPRLPRGSRREPVTAGWEIEKENRDRFNAIAAANDLSAGALFDLLVETMPLDLNGRPTWLPPKPPKDGELLIDSA